MIKLIYKTALVILISFFVTIGVLLYSKNNYSKHSHEINASLAYDRLEKLNDSTKVVIISGSSGAFSINSRILHDSLNLPVVNTSTHAGIGIRMQFELYKDFLKGDDIVIFCPEYYCTGLARLYGEEALVRILSTHLPSSYTKVNMTQWTHIYKYYGKLFIDDLKCINIGVFDTPYAAKYINEFGDIESERPNKDGLDKYTFLKELDEETLKYYLYIHKYCQSKKIKLLHMPPNLTISNYEYQEEVIQAQSNYFKEHNIPFLVNPERYAFDDSLFFDTPYHMTLEGAKQRSLLLVEDIKRILK